MQTSRRTQVFSRIAIVVRTKACIVTGNAWKTGVESGRTTFNAVAGFAGEIDRFVDLAFPIRTVTNLRIHGWTRRTRFYAYKDRGRN